MKLMCWVLVGLTTVVSVDAQDRSAADVMPSSTVVYGEISDPPSLLSTIFDHPIRHRIELMEPWKMATQQDGYQKFLMGRKFFELQLSMEWREALDALTANGIYFGVDAATDGAILLVRAKDKSVLNLFRIKLLELTRLGESASQIKEGEYRGIKAYQVDKTKIAVIDDWLLVTNKNETGKAVIDLMLDGGESLAGETFYQDASKQIQDESAWVVADVDTLRNATGEAFTGEAENPGVEFLVGGILDLLQETPLAIGKLDLSEDRVRLKVSVPSQTDWISEERDYFFGPDQSGRAAAVPKADETLFSLSTYRDASEMWLRAGDLFNERINDGIAEADASLTTLFAGRDFGEDILGSITPQMAFVASRQSFKELPIPTIKLPQFALVLKLRDPEKMTRELRRTFQSMIGFFNVVGAMEGRPQLEMDIEKLDDAELITSIYIPEEDDEGSKNAPILFNFSPSVGFAGERFVVSSTKGLARELIVAQDANRGAVANTHAQLEAGVLQTVLQDNREQLIAQNMLEDGNGREEAAAAIDLLLEVVGYFQNASLELKPSDDQLELQLEVQVRDNVAEAARVENE